MKKKNEEEEKEKKKKKTYNGAKKKLYIFPITFLWILWQTRLNKATAHSVGSPEEVIPLFLKIKRKKQKENIKMSEKKTLNPSKESWSRRTRPCILRTCCSWPSRRTRRSMRRVCGGSAVCLRVRPRRRRGRAGGRTRRAAQGARWAAHTPPRRGSAPARRSAGRGGGEAWRWRNKSERRRNLPDFPWDVLDGIGLDVFKRGCVDTRTVRWRNLFMR